MGVVALVGGGTIAALETGLLDTSIEVTNDEPKIVEVEKEVQPDWATDEEAVAAAQAVVERKRLENELETLNMTWASTTEAYAADKAKYEAAKAQLEKELGIY